MNLQTGELLGSQTPRMLWTPLLSQDVRPQETADECIEFLTEIARYELDEWQELCVRLLLAENEAGKWEHLMALIVNQRQNGKGDVIEMRELCGLFVLGEGLQLHTAHRFPTANEAFLRIQRRIESVPDLRRRISRFRLGNGDQAVELKNGARLKYATRTDAGARGFAGVELGILDESMILSAEMVASIMPVISALPNPQLIGCGSAGLASSSWQWELRKGAVRALDGAGTGDGVMVAEWGVQDLRRDIDDEGREVWSMTVPELPWDVMVARANAAAGGRIGWRYLRLEHETMPRGQWLRERCGVWDAPPADLLQPPKIPPAIWDAAARVSPPEPQIGGVTVGVDVDPDSVSAAVSVAWGAGDLRFVEVVEGLPGVAWVPAKVAAVCERWGVRLVGVNGTHDGRSLVGHVEAAIRAADLTTKVVVISAGDMATASAGFLADLAEGRLGRPPDSLLDQAGAVAVSKRHGDGFLFAAPPDHQIACLRAAVAARSMLADRLPIDSGPVFAF